MDSQELSLTWDNHQSTLVEVFEKLLESSTLVDCTIAAEGQYLRAHKVILSACSPYFELLFKQEHEKNPIIVLKDVKFRELKAMIDFVYHGKVRIPEDCLGDFLATAESLQIKGLSGGQNTDVSQKKSVTSSIYKRESHVSPVLQKYVRRKHENNQEENISSLSSDIDIASESHSCESFPQIEESVDASISFPSICPSPSPICASSEEVYGLRVREELNTVTEPPLNVQPIQSSIPLTETHSHLLSTEIDIKNEPVPGEESSIPETEDFLESKQEIAEELLVLESEDKMEATADNMCEQNSIQFSNFPPIVEAAEMRSNESFQMTEDSRSQGAASAGTATADETFLSAQPLQPTTTRASLRRTRTAVTANDYPPSPPAKHTCTFCGRVCSTASVLARHQRVHMGGRPLVSAVRCRALSDKHNPKQHLRVGTSKRPFVCLTCGMAFSQNEHLRRHQRVHTGERPFVCTTCDSAFSRKDALQKHQLVHTGERPFVCTTCGKAFSLNGSLKQHLRVHTGERPFACSTCGMAFSQNEHLRTHQRVHTGERPFVCTTCAKAFSHKCGLERHLRMHAGERPFACSTCGKAFSQNEHLRRHQRVHTGERPYECTTCGSAFSQKSALQYHQLVHTGERPFVCTTCGRAFSLKCILQKHLMVHTGERPFVCTTCGKAFTQKGNLEQHLRVHTGERPFACSTCGMTFTQRGHLLRHQRVHTGERLFVCAVCGRSFTGKQALKRHQHVHTAERMNK